MIHMRNLMTGCLLAAFLCAASCGCSKDNGGGEEGGRIIATGTPEDIKKNKTSITGQYL